MIRYLEENALSYSVIYIILLSLSSIACLLSIIVIFLAIFKQKAINPNIFATINLLISSFLHSIGYTLTFLYRDKEIKDDYIICQLQAFLETCFSLSMDLWICILTFRNYQIFYKNLENLLEQKKVRNNIIYSIIAYIIPLGITFALYGSHFFGKSGKTCWVKSSYKRYGFIIFGVRIACLAFICIYSTILLTVLTADPGKKSDKIYFFLKIIIYPAIQTLNILVPLIYFLININSNDPPEWFEKAELIFGSFVGVVYPGAYLILDIINIGVEKIEKINENQNSSLANSSIYLEDDKSSPKDFL